MSNNARRYRLKWWVVPVRLRSGKRTTYYYYAEDAAHARERALKGYPETDRDPCVAVTGEPELGVQDWALFHAREEY